MKEIKLNKNKDIHVSTTSLPTQKETNNQDNTACECVENCECCNEDIVKISPIGRDVFLNSKIDQETERAIAKENELEAEIEAAGKIDDVKVDGTSVVTNKVANIVLQPKIDIEKSRAESAEQTLTTNLSTEVTNRTNADTTLQTNINNEAATRSSEDAKKVDKVNVANKIYGTDNNGQQTTYDKDSFGKVDDVKVDGTSVVTNKVANVSLQPKIDIEANLRQQADTLISNTLTSHTSNVSNPHQVNKGQLGLNNVDNTSDLDKPVSTATQAAINAEALSRSNQDTILQQNITAEATRAAAAEALLETKVDATSKLNTAKAYTDSKVGDEANLRISAINAEALSRTTEDTNLQEQIDNLKSRGRYLSLWNCVTGLPQTFPTPTEYPFTYQYHAGDYFVIGTVATESGGVNKRPSGTSITKQDASSPWVVGSQTETVAIDVDDVYYFDGTNWAIQFNTQKVVRFANLAGQPRDNTNLSIELTALETSISSGLSNEAQTRSNADTALSNRITSIETAYLKNASVSGITLTLTKQDDTTITFVGSDFTVAEERIIEDE